MASLFSTGIRPAVDEYLAKESAKVRDYGLYWSASSGGYCMRLNILKRLQIPEVPEMADSTERQTRVFESGKIFHEWIQRITKETGLSIAQEIELQDEELMIRGHIDDLVLVGRSNVITESGAEIVMIPPKPHLILYDYKTAHSKWFEYKKNQAMSHYHKMQLGTYMYMLRKGIDNVWGIVNKKELPIDTKDLTEARILSISKDDLRMSESQLFWSPELEKEVLDYWKALNKAWEARILPKCTCLDHDGGFMGKRSKKGKIYNPYFYEDVPCSTEWVIKHKDLMKGWKVER